MAERIPPGVVNYRPYDFMELEPLICLNRRVWRYYFTADNVATRKATAKDEFGKPIPEISIIWNFFSGFEHHRATDTPNTSHTVPMLNLHLKDIRDISPLYVVMQMGRNGPARAGRLIQFVETDTGIQPLLKSEISRAYGLPPTEAIYADPLLVQKVGPANTRPGRRR